MTVPSRAKTTNTGKNVLVIIADDLAYNELGCYGGTNIKTPHIDQLAQEGIQFNQMYSSSTMCSPTRASIYTGLYPVRNGIYKNHADTKPEVESVTRYLGDMGYRVGITGKIDVRPKSVYKFQVVDGFESNCVSDNTAWNTDGILNFMKQDKPFCLYVGSTNPHVPWTGGDASHIDPGKLRLPPVYSITKKRGLHFQNIWRKWKNWISKLVTSLVPSNKAESTIKR